MFDLSLGRRAPSPFKAAALAPFKAAALVLALALAGGAAAQSSKSDGAVPMADLLRPAEIEDQALGDPTAPVTIIEYASLTCPHCASFHKLSLPVLKADFIDTGKVRFIFRDFPFDGLALAGSMVARCSGKEKYFAVLDALFAEQENWAFSKDPEAALTAFALRHGFTQESFTACLQNPQFYDGVLAGRQRAYEAFGVNSTPTLFINGVRYRGALSPGDLAEAVKAALPEGKK